MAKMGRFALFFINRRTASRAARLLRELDGRISITPQSRVLELGAGGGGLIARVVERFRPGRYVGTDFDANEVDEARRFLVERFGTLPPSVELRVADALSIPFPDASFDLVFAIMMLHHVEERHSDYAKRPRALQEIRRVLAPGGVLVYSDFSERRKLRDSLRELGFQPVWLREHWRHDVAVFRTTSP